MNTEEQEMKEVFAPYLESWFPDWSDYFSIERGKEIKYYYDKSKEKPCFVIADIIELVLHEIGHFVFASDEQAVTNNYDLYFSYFTRIIGEMQYLKTPDGHVYDSEVFAHSMYHYLINSLKIESIYNSEEMTFITSRYRPTQEPTCILEVKADSELLFEKICCIEDEDEFLKTLRLHIIGKCKRLKRLKLRSRAATVMDSKRTYDEALRPIRKTVLKSISDNVGKSTNDMTLHVDVKCVIYTASIYIDVDKDVSLDKIPQEILDYVFNEGFESVTLNLPNKSITINKEE